MVTQFTPKGNVKTINGSITQAINGGLRLILLPLSVGNTKFNVGNSLTSKLTTRYPGALAKVKMLNSNAWEFKVGTVSTIPVGVDTWIMTLACLDANEKQNKDHLTKSLKELLKVAKLEKDSSVHISSLAVSNCPDLIELVNEYIVKEGISVNYYQD